MQTSASKPAIGIACTVLSVLLIVGLMTFAGPCVHEDGTIGSCGWAARAMVATSVVALVLSVVRIFERDEGERRGLDLGIALVGVLVALTPGMIVGLCMMETMRCHTIMAPFARIVGTALALVAASDLVRRLVAVARGR